MTAVLDGIIGEHAARMDDERAREESTKRLGVTLVSGRASRHGVCGDGRCRHRNHRRDGQYRDTMLDALGLPEEPAKPGDYDAGLYWASFNKAEAQLMR